MKIQNLIILASALISSLSFASSYDAQAEFLALYEFSGVAYEKEVQSVVAHTGTVRERNYTVPQREFSQTWENVTDIEMTRVGDHFFAKKDFPVVNGGGGEAGYDKAVAVGVTYLITFTDGSTRWSDVTISQPNTYYPWYAGYDRQAVEADEHAKFNGAQDANKSYVVEIENGQA